MKTMKALLLDGVGHGETVNVPDQYDGIEILEYVSEEINDDEVKHTISRYVYRKTEEVEEAGPWKGCTIFRLQSVNDDIHLG